jgi:hypothetical protein
MVSRLLFRAATLPDHSNNRKPSVFSLLPKSPTAAQDAARSAGAAHDAQ